jgi:hypothetical protein
VAVSGIFYFEQVALGAARVAAYPDVGAATPRALLDDLRFEVPLFVEA